MADSRRNPATGSGPGGEPSTGMPRWVWISGISAIVLILLVVLMMFVGGGSGGHGPSRHSLSDVPALPSSVVATVLAA